ncbi:MAG: spore coat protein [Defluviitaleaceae bacterium]|nr:spore coat protein [Defluviitaleaceae bacterium]
MNDQLIMTNILSLVKGASDMYMHGAIEAACPKINAAFKQALAANLALQHEVFDAMKQKGWYPIPEETPENINKVVQEFATGC